MNFLKEPWIIGFLIGILVSIGITIFDMITGNNSFIESFSPLFTVSLGSLGVILGLLIDYLSKRGTKTIPASQSIKRRWAFIGGFIGFIFDLFVIFSGSPDPAGAIVFGLIFLPIFVGVGALAGYTIGTIRKRQEGRSFLKAFFPGFLLILTVALALLALLYVISVLSFLVQR